MIGGRGCGGPVWTRKISSGHLKLVSVFSCYKALSSRTATNGQWLFPVAFSSRPARGMKLMQSRQKLMEWNRRAESRCCCLSAFLSDCLLVCPSRSRTSTPALPSWQPKESTSRACQQRVNGISALTSGKPSGSFREDPPTPKKIILKINYC